VYMYVSIVGIEITLLRWVVMYRGSVGFYLEITR
jgi:hypothetical protein